MKLKEIDGVISWWWNMMFNLIARREPYHRLCNNVSNFVIINNIEC